MPEELINLLGLTPHPTCGLVKQTFVSNIVLPKEALPDQYNSDRPAGSVLYFMLTVHTQVKLHKIRSDQMYHFYFGCPVEVFLLYPDGNFEIKCIGNDLRSNMTPQLFIPGDTFHATQMRHHEKYFCSLLGTSEWIGVEPSDIEIGDPEKLIGLYPDIKNELVAFL